MIELKFESLRRLYGQFSVESIKEELRKEYQSCIDGSQGAYIWGTGLLGRFACKQMIELCAGGGNCIY